MVKKLIRKFSSPLELLGLPDLPDPGEIHERVQQITGIVEEAKNLPETAINHFVRADEDFRNAQKTFQGVRLRKSKKV